MFSLSLFPLSFSLSLLSLLSLSHSLSSLSPLSSLSLSLSLLSPLLSLTTLSLSLSSFLSLSSLSLSLSLSLSRSLSPPVLVPSRRVPVPDSRYDWLCEFWKPPSTIPAYLHVVDIAGLVKGAHEGQVSLLRTSVDMEY